MLCSSSGGGCRASSAGMVRSEKGGSAAATRHRTALRVRPAAPNAAARRILAAPLLVRREGAQGRNRAEKQRRRLRQLGVSRGSCDGPEARADGLLRAAAPPALADKGARWVAQDAVQHQRARVVVAVMVEHMQRLPVRAHRVQPLVLGARGQHRPQAVVRGHLCGREARRLNPLPVHLSGGARDRASSRARQKRTRHAPARSEVVTPLQHLLHRASEAMGVEVVCACGECRERSEDSSTG